MPNVVSVLLFLVLILGCDKRPSESKAVLLPIVINGKFGASNSTTKEITCKTIPTVV